MACLLLAALPFSSISPAQVQTGTITGLTLDSPAAGTLMLEWVAANPYPTDYRVVWAKQNEEFMSWTPGTGNHYPDTNGDIIAGLDPGQEYKVKVRVRYYQGSYQNAPWSWPWSNEVSLTVAASQPRLPEGGVAVPGNPLATSAGTIPDDLVLLSTQPGFLWLSWTEPDPVPDRYRINWATEGVVFPSWDSDDAGGTTDTTITPFYSGTALWKRVSGTRCRCAPSTMPTPLGAAP